MFQGPQDRDLSAPCNMYIDLLYADTDFMYLRDTHPRGSGSQALPVPSGSISLTLRGLEACTRHDLDRELWTGARMLLNKLWVSHGVTQPNPSQAEQSRHTATSRKGLSISIIQKERPGIQPLHPTETETEVGREQHLVWENGKN